MSRRRGIQVTHDVVVNPEAMPANFRDATAHVRVYWPPNATRAQVLEALRNAVMLAVLDIEQSIPEEGQ